jgi:ADP-ribose pyrophosphatase YjhB (NUDIX family)
MDKQGYKITVGGIVKKDNSILLVKHGYGHTRGRWDFPRGYVEIDESIEAAVIREVYEETSIKATPIGIIGIRHMLQILNENDVSNELLTIWELKYEEGNPKPDGREIIEAAFFQIDELLNSPEIGGWTKEIVSSSLFSNGLKNSTYSPKSHPNGTIYWKSYLE